jgi:hypothetical protein
MGIDHLGAPGGMAEFESGLSKQASPTLTDRYLDADAIDVT